MEETELNEESKHEMNNNTAHVGKNVFVKVFGLVAGIVAAIVILSIIISKTLLPAYRYYSADKHAEKGDYVTATHRLQGLVYKDSLRKYGEYASTAAESYYNSNDMDKALEYFRYAFSSNIEEYRTEAVVYCYIIQPESVEYSEELAKLALSEANELYESGDKDKAKVYYTYARDSQDEDIKAQAESRLSE